MNDEPARVFISCGQGPNSEREIANFIEKMLNEEGFNAYVATQEQTLRSVPDNIFERLRNTEYLLFIDFRREQLNSGEYRGSLFSHQELAIAAFLGLDNDVLIFQEESVERGGGMLGMLQGNATSFRERADLVDSIKRLVKEKWRNDWRRQLVLEQADDPNCEAVRQNSGTVGFFFHIKVKNRHIRATARSCCAYLRSVTDNVTGEKIMFEASELRWAGYNFPTAIIPPGNFIRRFDAVWFDSGDPLRPRFSIFSDWPRSLPNLRGPGKWDLQFEVISDNVPGSTIAASLEVQTDGCGVSPLPSHVTVCFGRAKPAAEITHLSEQQLVEFNKQRMPVGV